MRDAFYPENDDNWKKSVSSLAEQIFHSVFTKMFNLDFVPKVSDKAGISLFGCYKNPPQQNATPVVEIKQSLAARV
jgi:hypothetical protein